ncbi:hypothetical protein BOW53_13990 [Solemya pervernicosa gill symbiont]|uniref:Sensory/regulatory protein RpfC n=1 Tax=Solemya pervernicosa gill symbiont TaxID=642797 RepID=A0A1T2L158_9GAMM|nr:hypothetical protein BOW53_13990 [Solemya pervernicosa gill symbiont]
MPILLLGILFTLYFNYIWKAGHLAEARKHNVEESQRELTEFAKMVGGLVDQEDDEELSSILDDIHAAHSLWVELGVRWSGGRTVTSNFSRPAVADSSLIYRQQTAVEGGHAGQPQLFAVLDLSATHEERHYEELLWSLLSILLLFAVVSLLLLEWLVRRPVEGLVTAAQSVADGNFESLLPRSRNDEVGGLIHHFDVMRQSLKSQSTQLAEEIEGHRRAEVKIEHDYHAQRVLSSILRISLEPTKLEELLGCTLDLLMTVPWLDIEAKGCMFLADEKADTLHMVAQRGLSEEIRGLCSTLPVGKCICGQAAERREIFCVTHVDERHEIRPEGIHDHGHLCVPIMIEDHLLGIINLYTMAGVEASVDTIDLLSSVSNTLASVIQRMRATHALEDAQQALEQRVIERTSELETANDQLLNEMVIRNDAEEQAKRSIAELETQKFALDQHSIVGIADREGRISYANDLFCAISKYSRDELIGEDHRILNSGYHSSSFFKEMWLTITRGEVWRGEIRNQNKEGNYYWVDTTIVPFMDDSGRPYQFVSIRTDITERKRTLWQQQARQERLREHQTALLGLTKGISHEEVSLDVSIERVAQVLLKTLNVARVSIWFFDSSESRLYGKAYYCAGNEHLDSDAESLMRSRYPSFFNALEERHLFVASAVQSDHVFAEIYNDCFAAHDVQSVIGATIRQSGDVVGVLFAEHCGEERYWHTDEQGFVNNIADMVTVALEQAARIETENALKLARDTAVQASKVKSEFLAAMSHEIRTPMNGVLGMLGLLEDTELNNEQGNYVSTANGSAQTLLTLLNDILDFSKLEAGRVELEAIEFDLFQLCGDVCDLAAGNAYNKGLEITCDIDEQVPEFVVADPTRLRQVITNLLGNAVKFTSEGEIRFKVAVQSKEGSRLRLRFDVHDTGIGVDATARGQIFGAFSQADGSTSRKYGGTGLGLSISKQLVDAMGGEIDVDSIPGEGSDFWFAIDVELGGGLRPSICDSCLRDVKVLIADSHPHSSAVIATYLDQMGADFEIVEGAESLVETVDNSEGRQQFEIAIIDAAISQQLPVEELPGLKSIAASIICLARAGQIKDDDCRRLAHSATLIKPVGPRRLADVVDEVIHVDTDPHAQLVAVDSQASVRKDRILVVDDNQVNQRVAVSILSKLGFQADVVDNGRKAVEASAEGGYDLILMDCQMPEMDGYEASGEIRKLAGSAANTTIVAMTAHVLEGERERCIEAGMDDYISKPIQVALLGELLQHWLGEGEQLEAAESVETVSKEGVDPAVVAELRNMMGDEALGSLATIFLDDMALRIDEMTSALNDSNPDSFILAAHTLKGSSSNVGARELFNFCQQIETDVRADGLDAIKESFDQILDISERVRSGLNEAVAAE